MSCKSCGESVVGMKFCGSCGTKVEPGSCTKCNSELLLNAKFCIECGWPVKKPVNSASAPTATPETVNLAPASETSGVEAEPLSSGNLQTPPGMAEEVAPTPSPKKHVSVKVEAPKCNVCGKSVFRMEEAHDSSGLVFHKECFRCKTCKAFLNGRERVMEPESGISVKVANGMYLVAREGSHLGNKGDFFCDKHSVKARGEVVKAQDIEEKYRDDNELKRIASMRKEANEEARQSMQARVGDLIAMCSRCGRPIDRGQKAIASGMEKIHETCPTQEESDKAVRPARWFVKKAPERAAGTLTCDKNTKHPHTFLFELDKATLTEALKKNSYEAVKLVLVPDSNAHTSASKKLVVPSSEAAREFDFAVKDFANFTFANPKKNNEIQKPTLDKSSHTLTITKYAFTNNVVQTMEAIFKYDEATQMCNAEKIIWGFEMYPPEVAAEMESLDPLAELKQNLA